MKNSMKALALATAAMAASTVAPLNPAMAQSRTKIATADVNSAVAKSTAYTNAVQQIQTTYAADLQQIQTRATALQAEIKPLQDAYQAAASAPNATQASVRPAAEALQAKQVAAQRELTQLRQRVDLARAYVEEQIVSQLDAAIRAAMKAKNVDLLLPANGVLAREPYVDMSDAVVTEINKLVPSVQVVPPAGWQPGQNQQQAQQSAAPQTDGR